MSKYQRKPDVVDAVQYNAHTNEDEMLAFCPGLALVHDGIFERLMYGEAEVEDGCYVGKDVSGYYIFSQDNFEEFYEPIIKECPHKYYRVLCNNMRPMHNKMQLTY